MAHEDEVEVGFGADISELQEKLNEALESLTKRFEGLTDTFGKVGKAFEALTAVVGGVEAFEKAIEVTTELIDVTRGFMEVTGDAAAEAQAIITGMEEAGGSAETYESALHKLEIRLQNNTAAFDRYHVAYKDANGELLSTDEVMRNVVERLSELQVGSNRNKGAFELLGRGAGDLGVLIRGLSANTEEIAEKQAALGLVIDDSTIKMRDDYRKAIVGVHEVFDALLNQIGQTVMPLLTDLAEWFSARGPEAVGVMIDAVTVFGDVFSTLWQGATVIVESFEGVLADLQQFLLWMFAVDGDTITGMQLFANMLKVIEVGFEGLKEVVGVVVNSILYGIDLTIDSFKVLGGVMHKIATGEANELNHAMQEFQNDASNGQEALNKIFDDTAEKVAKILELTNGKKETIDFGKGDSWDKGGKAPKTPVPGVNEARLAVTRAEEQAIADIKKEYLKEDEDDLKRAYDQGVLTTAQYYDRLTQLQQESIDASIAAKEAESAATMAAMPKAKNEEEMLKLKAKELQLEGQIMILQAQRAQAGAKNDGLMLDAQQKTNDALDQQAIVAAKGKADNEIAIEQNAITTMASMRQISSKQTIQLQMQEEDKSFAISLDALNKQKALIRGNQDDQIKARAVLDGQIEAAEQAHQLKLTQLSRQADLDRQQFSIQASQSLENNFETFFEGFDKGVQGMRANIINLGKNIESTFVKLIAQNFVQKLFGPGDSVFGPLIANITKMVTTWIFGQAKMTASSGTASTTRIGQTTAEASATAAAQTAAVAGQQALGVASVLSNAAVYAVAAMASVAEIPVYGWAMAPGVGAEAYATGLAYLPSAAQGWWQVPDDTLANIHKDEMVMPAPLAQGMRDVIEGGGPSGGGGGQLVLQGTHMGGGFFMAHQNELMAAFNSAQKKRRG